MPSLGMVTINALSAADSVIIPVQAQYLPAKGMTQLVQTISRVKSVMIISHRLSFIWIADRIYGWAIEEAILMTRLSIREIMHKCGEFRRDGINAIDLL